LGETRLCFGPEPQSYPHATADETDVYPTRELGRNPFLSLRAVFWCKFSSASPYFELLNGNPWRCAVRLGCQPLYPPSQPPLSDHLPTRRPSGRQNAPNVSIASPLSLLFCALALLFVIFYLILSTYLYQSLSRYHFRVLVRFIFPNMA